MFWMCNNSDFSIYSLSSDNYTILTYKKVRHKIDSHTYISEQQTTNQRPHIQEKTKLHMQLQKKTRYAILVNDMLNDFIHGKLKSDRARQIIPKLGTLLDTARQKGVPIFYCNDEHDISDPELKLWGPHAIKYTEGSKVINELEPKPTDYIIPKRSYGSFDNTDLDILLRSTYGGYGANTLIITGIHTHICVKHTTYGGFIRGYDIIIPEDAVTAFTEENHKSGLQYMVENYGITIKQTSQLISELQGWFTYN
jgi:nicotinamidase-related amidase